MFRWGGGSKPTIVLEHGAWADASSWAKVILQLQEDGFTVDAPPNPLRGVSYDSTYLADFLSTIPGPIVLVGHSYGGFVITNAATGNSNVKALVYVDAFIPDVGDSVPALAKGSCVVGNLTDLFNIVPIAGDADLYLKPSLVPTCFANGLPASQAALIAATQRPLAASAFGATFGTPAWKTIPSWAVIGTQDHVIPLANQTFMAQRAGARITDVNAGHLSLISKPSVVTSVILRAVQATS
jgi:pimeloyl-ACP methyl ester carboxylesterase